MEADSSYLECVQLLEDELLCHPPFVRPTASQPLAPFDQASQKTVFGKGGARGSPEEFLGWARGREHPAEARLPSLDADLECAVQFVWQCGSGIAAERERRLTLLRHVASRLEPLTVALSARMSDNAIVIARAMMLNIMRRKRPSASLADVGDGLYAPHFGLWCALLDALRWPNRNLVESMLRGFRTVRDVPDSGVWRAVDRPASIPFHEFAQTNAAWVHSCKHRLVSAAAKDLCIEHSGQQSRVAACWERTLEERDAGLILGPFTIAEINAKRAPGAPALGFGRWRPLPRFAIWNGKKWRCIDDGAASGTNSKGTSVHETIVCDRADSPMRIGIRFHQLGPPSHEPALRVLMGGGTDDKFAAYRVVVTCDSEYTVVMVVAPPDALFAGSPLDTVLFKVPGHNFGLVSAVTNWHSASEPPVVFSRRFFATPVTRFYDDHQVSEPQYAGASGQHVHFELHELLRFHFDIGKHVSWSRHVLYTGVVTDWTLDYLEGIVSIGVSSERRHKLRIIIQAALDADSLSPAESSSLRGKARWSVCPVFGRLGVAIVHLLRERQQQPSDGGDHPLDAQLAEALRLLHALMQWLPNHVVRFRRDTIIPAGVILTDASFEASHAWLGFLVVCPIRGGVWAGMATPPWLLALLELHKARDTYIGQLEAVAALAPLFSLSSAWFTDRNMMHYIDNQGALYSLINGRSNDVDINRLVFIARLMLQKMRCDTWFDYVPSASNFADLPTRLDADAFRRLDRVARRLPMVLPPRWCLACAADKLTPLFY